MDGCLPALYENVYCKLRQPLLIQIGLLAYPIIDNNDREFIESLPWFVLL